MTCRHDLMKAQAIDETKLELGSMRHEYNMCYVICMQPMHIKAAVLLRLFLMTAGSLAERATPACRAAEATADLTNE